MKNRKRYSAKQKVIILREHLDDQVSISDLSEKYGIHPNIIHKWKKKLFDNAEELFDTTYTRNNGREEAKIANLEAKIQERDSLISEIVKENIYLKKSFNGDI